MPIKLNRSELMDAIMMLVVACVAGEPTCTAAQVKDIGFTTVEACEARIDEITSSMTQEFGKRQEFKGRQVTYDVSCMNRSQLQLTLGSPQTEA